MTLGEKIKYYRTTLGITQAQFSSLSGIGLSTVKKLERDMMNPKPQMLMKIANALGVSINIFTDFDIETVSDVMSLLTKMDEQTDMDFIAEYDEDGLPDPKTIRISFEHPSMQKKLADYVRTRDLQKKIDEERTQYTKPAEQEAYSRMDENLEQARLSICQDNTIITKEFRDGHIHVKLSPS
ncbi:MAG: helix-turn-helix transcriptional regulator [Lachnospiraceae bacterium]|nr:helix-turn-helix transcriptional regulator [Lachnospiraceae bacterium]